MTTTCQRHLADAGRRLRSYEKLTLDSTSVAMGLTKISITHALILYQVSTLVELHSCMYGGDFFVSSNYEQRGVLYAYT